MTDVKALVEMLREEANDILDAKPYSMGARCDVSLQAERGVRVATRALTLCDAIEATTRESPREGGRGAHTPGPWRVEWVEMSGFPRALAGGKVTAAIPNERVYRWTVATVEQARMPLHTYEESQAEAEANAHLIAAAPDLLAALEQLREFIRDGWGGAVRLQSSSLAADVYADGLFRRVDAAIARAQGSSPRTEGR